MEGVGRGGERYVGVARWGKGKVGGVNGGREGEVGEGRGWGGGEGIGRGRERKGRGGRWRWGRGKDVQTTVSSC